MTPWVTRLIIANVAVFLLTSVLHMAMGPFILVPAYILLRPWTVITYMFLHANVMHILFNMITLFFFGTRLEAFLGGRRFLWLYFLSGIMGAAVSFIFAPYTAIIGASGGVFGVELGFAYFWPRDRIYVWGVIPVEARWLVAIMTALTLYGGFGGGGDGIAHFAHLGGFLGGYLYLRWIDRRARRHRAEQSPRQMAPKSSDLERWMTINRESLHEVNREEFDRIMQKMKDSGPASLTPQERGFLDRFSAR
jgi:membrane associated rhomboid family serine protease